MRRRWGGREGNLTLFPLVPSPPCLTHPVTLPPPPFNFSLTFFPPCQHSQETKRPVEKKKKTTKKTKKKRGRAEKKENDVSYGHGVIIHKFGLPP